MWFKRLVVGCATLLVVIVASDSRLSAQRSQSQWDGVFTVEQAGRGEAVYSRFCATCHGSDLAGEGHAPALTGDTFAVAWNDRPLSVLFDRIKTTMPPTSPGRLTPRETADLVAFVLRASSYPAGEHELADTVEALQVVRFFASKP